MTAMEFVKGLERLQKEHENDKYSVFETNWCALCKEAADMIVSLKTENDALKDDLKTWQEWWDRQEIGVEDKPELKVMDIYG